MASKAQAPPAQPAAPAAAAAGPQQQQQPQTDPYRRLESELEMLVPTDQPANSSVIVYGRRRTGKTTWVTWYLYWNRYKWADVYVLSTTAFNGHYQKFVPAHHIVPEFNEEVVQTIIDHQRQDSSMPVLIVLDDVLDQFRDIRKSSAMMTLFASGRHLNIGVLLCTQYPRSIPPVFRQNVDLAVMFQCGCNEIREMLYKAYGHILTYRMFCHMLDVHTVNHGSLVALPCEQTVNPLRAFRKSKADLMEGKAFSVGVHAMRKSEEQIQENTEYIESHTATG